MAQHIFTSESVSEGHPDKIADQISDAVLDAILEQDAEARVACETFVKTGMVLVGGEIAPILRVGSSDGQSVLWRGGGNKRKRAVTIDNVRILRDQNRAVNVSEEVDIGQEGQILTNDIDIVEGFVGVAGRTIVDVQCLRLREELLEVAA